MAPTSAVTTAAEPGGGRSGLWMALTEALWLAPVVVIPLYFNPLGSEVYEGSKAHLFRILIGLLAVAWVVALSVRPEGRRPAGPLRAPRGRSRLEGALYGLVGAYALSLLLSTLVSLSPAQSWWGGVGRGRGAFTTLGFLFLFVVVATSARGEPQARRVVTALLAGSLPVTLYALSQQLGWDPIPHAGDPTTLEWKVRSTLGQHLFLGAYLIMVMPLAAAEGLRALDRWRSDEARAALPLAVLGPSLWWNLGVLGGQVLLLALVFRIGAVRPGAWIGYLPVLALVVLSGLLLRDLPDTRRAAAVRGASYLGLLLLQLGAVYFAKARGPWIGLLAGGSAFFFLLVLRRRRFRWAVAGGALVALAVGALVLLNLPQSPLRAAGRLGQLFEVTEASSGWVRLMIWRSVVRLPVAPPVLQGGDALGWLRPAFGYGPDTAGLVLDKVLPARLLQHVPEQDGRILPYVWDRAHNDLLDHLLEQGVVGAVLFAGILAVVMGLGVSRLWRSADSSRQLTLAAFVSGIVAHAVETQIGIAVVASRLVLWLAAALLVAARGWEHEPGVPVAARPEPAGRPAGRPGPRGRPSKRKTETPASRDADVRGKGGRGWGSAVAGYGLLTLVGLWVLATTYVDSPPAFLPFALGLTWLVVGLVLAGLGLRPPAEGAGGSPRWWGLVGGAGALALLIVPNVTLLAADLAFASGQRAYAGQEWLASTAAFQAASRLAPWRDLYYAGLGGALRNLAGAVASRPAASRLTSGTPALLTLTPSQLARLSPEDLLTLSGAAFEEAKRREPLDIKNHLNLARLELARGERGDAGRVERALALYESAMALSPNNMWVLAEGAYAAVRAGNLGLAEERAKRALDLGAGRLWIPHLVLAEVYARTGRRAQALRAAETARSLAPPGSQERVARLIEALGAR